MSAKGDIRAARRYAGALFAAASKARHIENVQSDLDAIMQLWSANAQFAATLQSPLAPNDSKHALVDSLFKTSADPVTLAFLHLLVDKNREEVLPLVQEEFARLADDASGTVRAHAEVALPIDDSEKAAIQAALQKRTGKNVSLSVSVNPAILGGVLVRLNDTVIDGSVRGTLENLREKMLMERGG
jgi:F-type H+-transporting ATPase subunit delta